MKNLKINLNCYNSYICIMDIWKILGGSKVSHENIKYAEKLSIHAVGDGIENLINTYRPNEPENIQKYRSENVRAVTKSYWSKAKSVVKKINRSGYDIKFTEGTERTKEWTIKQKLTDRLFTEFLTLLLKDPRAAIVVTDYNWINSIYETNIQDVGIFTFTSDEILYFSDNHLVARKPDFAVWFDYEKKTITIFKINEENKWYQFDNFEGLQGEYFFIGGKSDALSFFDASVDFWFEALVQYSDLQASIKSHAFPIAAMMNLENCKTCAGTGQVMIDEHKHICGTCHGSGYISASPYANISLSAEDYKRNPQLPFPNVAYIQRNLEPIKLLKEEYEANIQRGLQAINMEFLNVGLNQSGVAKAIDRDELNGLLYDWANFIFNWLYFSIVKNAGIYIQGVEVLTSTILPESFDVYGLELAETSLKSARESNMSNGLLRQMEANYARMKYEGRPIEQAFADDLICFDFCYGLQPSESEVLLANGGLSKMNYQISVNLYFLLKKAYQIPDFFMWDFMRKYDWLANEANNMKIPTPEL